MRDIFKIVRIINDNNIVISGGKEQGLQEGDILEVFIKGEEIVDPDTNKCLGTLDVVKSKIEIKTLYEKMSLCHNAETITKNPFVSYDSSNLFKTSRVPLNVDMTQAQKIEAISDTVLRIGDLVRKAL